MKNPVRKFNLLVWGMALATIFAVASFMMILLKIDPADYGKAIILLFYATLFLSFVGISFIFMVYLRYKMTRVKNTEFFGSAFRRSIILSVFIVSILALRQLDLLNIISSVTFTVFALAIEVYFSRIRA